jgi:BirA family biotin operon repressor/biotin-[acetyl-CoA-carboxylase] ligase
MGARMPAIEKALSQIAGDGNTKPWRPRQVRMINLRKILENSFVADLEHHASIGSTNDRAVVAASEPGVRLPLLVLADAQTAGRGRGSNRWWTGQGSLAFSLLLETGASSRSSALISLASGIAVVDALAPLVPGHEIGIHWPNDVMLDGRKLAGILIEVLPAGKVVNGIGINTNNSAVNAPAEVRTRVATLRDATGCEHDATELLITILNHLERRLVELASSPEQIAARTNDLCLQRGSEVQICQGTQTTRGTCRAIAPDGALIVEVAGRSHAIYSGTVMSE